MAETTYVDNVRLLRESAANQRMMLQKAVHGEGRCPRCGEAAEVDKLFCTDCEVTK